MKKVFHFSLFLFSMSAVQGQAARLDSTQIFNQFNDLRNNPITEELFTRIKNLESLSEQINYIEGQALTKIWIGSYYRKTGQYEKAIEQYQKNLTFAKKYRDTSSITGTHLDLANAYTDINDLEKATEYIEQHIQLAKDTKDDRNLCLGLNSFGILAIKKGNLNKALDCFLEAKTISNTIELPSDFTATVNSNIGIIYVQLGKSEEAIQYFKELLEIKKTEKDTFELAPAYGNIAYAYQNAQQFETAFIYYDSSLYFSEKLGQDDVTYITYSDLSDGYKLKGDYKNALRFQKEYHNIQEKVINKKTKNNIAELEVKFETERKEKELLTSQQEVVELEQSNQIRQQKTWLIIGSLMASIIACFLIFFRAKNKAEQKRIEKKLIHIELKNKELEATQLQTQLTNKQSDLTNLALDIGRKNKFSNKLIKQLNGLQKIKPDEVKSQLREVISFASNHLQINDDLAFLQKNVETVNRTFYKNLEDNFGKLTANEKYLAGLIRLNLSNKEIASIKGISTSSAKMSRHRLRKKLELKPETDIVNFLQNI